MKRSEQQQKKTKKKKNSKVMGREKLFSAPGSVLIKTILLELLAEAVYSAHRQCSYQNKYEKCGQTVKAPCTLHLHTSGAAF